MSLPLILKVFWMNIMSCCSNSKQISNWLILLHEEWSISFFSNAVFNCCWFQRVGAWLFVFNLHPNWWKSIDFGDISKSLFFNWLLSVFFFRSNSDPTLSLWDDLHHFLRATIWVSVNIILIIRRFHVSKEVWNIFIVDLIHSLSRSSSFGRSWSWLISYSSRCFTS